MRQVVETEIGGRKLTLETGELAKQASGAVLVRYGDTVVLATAVAANEPKKDVDFFPLTIDYREKTYAAGKIPGGFFKREGRPTEKEVLTSRLIDRPIRPLFAEGFYNETQVMCMALSADQENDPDILAMIGASAALTISDIPFLGPINSARIGRIDNQFILNPTFQELEVSDMNIIMSATKDEIVMVEGGAKELSEEVLIDALMFGHESIKCITDLQLELQEKTGNAKISAAQSAADEEFVRRVEKCAYDDVKKAYAISDKLERKGCLENILNEVYSNILEDVQESEREEEEKRIKSIFSDIEKRIVRKQISDENIRIDGRGLEDIRPVTCSVGILPRTHGSAVFTRGETQALVALTLGTSIDEQTVERLEGRSSKTFMLHYNFPPFCVGETGFLRGPGRREIGHGALAERAIIPILPSNEKFPYTIRVVSDILESNGSSSMATVCGASLSLMDAGVPVPAPVAGIAMGLIKEGERFSILSDILGDEDHLGDMDFKVAGTANGITAFQMDIKIKGITRDVLEKALTQARNGRLTILEKMKEAISESRPELSDYAPRILTMQIKSDKVRDVIGPGGKVIKGIIEKTGASIDIDDKGFISISSCDEKSAKAAVDMIKNITQEAEIGKIYLGKVKKIMDFGAFVEIFPGTDGLVHISQIANHRVERTADELSEGEDVMVKVLDIDREGKIRLSRKEAMAEKAGGRKYGKRNIP